MYIMSYTLLMTWTIKPDPKVKKWYNWSIDPETRIKQYYKALDYYIKNSKFSNIVFCENSTFSYERFSPLKIECEQRWKKFEYITFKWDVNKTIEKTHAYWDMECIDYAINHSSLLNNNNSFYKITGRYIYKNIENILSATSNYKNYFFRRLDVFAFFEVNTAFFKVNKKDYYLYFYDLKSKINNEIMEQLYYRIIKNNNIVLWKVRVAPNREDCKLWFFNKLLFLMWFWNLKGFPWCVIEYIGNYLPGLRLYIWKIISKFKK